MYLVILTLLSTTHFCPGNQTCTDLFMRFSPWSLANYIFFTPFLLILSLIAYKMRDEVFRAWWNFARWFILLIVGVTFWVESLPSTGGFFNLDEIVYLFLIAPLYVIFVFTSATIIVNNTWKNKIHSLLQKRILFSVNFFLLLPIILSVIVLIYSFFKIIF